MSKWVEELYDDSFDATLAEHEVVFVDCYADWCGPCKAVAPVVERLARDCAGRVKFGKLNTDGNAATARRLRISSIPALLLFRDGNVVARTGGYQSDAQLRAWLGRYVPPPTTVPASAPSAPQTSLLSRIFGRG